jgi:hypothetical protein
VKELSLDAFRRTGTTHRWDGGCRPDSPLVNDGERSFKTPGKNSDGDNDWSSSCARSSNRVTGLFPAVFLDVVDR